MTPTEPITSFNGEFSFLSNFHPCPVNFEGIRFPTSEHAFQAAKTLDHNQRAIIAMLMTPGKAKRAGRKLHIRPDWERVKIPTMEKILRMKFSNPEMREKLLATGDRVLIEGNNWNDTFWGVCNNQGENHLGRLLMEIRNELA
jgi:N-glycosidase YbiA